MEANKIDNFLYRHFKRKGNIPANILVQPVEEITYGANSTSRFKIIKRHETELKWIKFLQTPIPWDLMTIYIMKVIFLKCQISMSSLCWNFANVQLDHMELKKNKNCKRKSRVQKLANCTLRDLAA